MAQRVSTSAPTPEIPGLPRAARRSFPALMADAAEPPSWMRAAVQKHLTEVRAAAESREFVDVDLAARVAAGLLAMLDGLGFDTSEVHRRAVYGAARYFALHDDGYPDLDSVTGFDDDAEVFNAVARFVGRDDLVIKID